MRVGSLLLRAAVAVDIDHLLSFRNDPVVNRFMIRTSVDPEAFRVVADAVEAEVATAFGLTAAEVEAFRTPVADE